MRKVMSFLAVVALIATVNTSCKKNYTCECCIDCPFTGEICNSETKKMKKKDAKAWCESNSSATGGCTGSCQLK